jgi:hypothetical protein
MRTLRVALLATGASASVLMFAGSAYALSVHVQRQVAVHQNVHITFHAHKVPEHGYYYAVIVLKRYREYTSNSPPPCSPSSNMFGTNYGYPQPTGVVALTLTPSESSLTKHWCQGGSYEGGVYAVPHPPPCESTYPCRSEPYERHCQGGHACLPGVVIRPGSYVYPGHLPRPLASGARIVARFNVKFP